jgi:Protein of unknown function (DUF3467)
VVILLAEDNLMSAEKLLQQHDPGELMGKRDRAQRNPLCSALQHRVRKPERPAQHETDVAAPCAAILEKAGQVLARERTALAIEGADVGVLRDALQQRRSLPLPVALRQLDRLDPGVASEQAMVVGDVVLEGSPNLSHAGDDQAHGGCDTRRVSHDQDRERHINMHMSPETMAGAYANFANISHSEYEFTITFARLDHEVDEDDIPGVVVSRLNASPKFMRELIDALEDNYSKWSTREGIKNLPEYREKGSDGGDEQSRSSTS